MSVWEVTVRREVISYETAKIQVEAETRQDAEEAATQVADNRDDLDWKIVNGMTSTDVVFAEAELIVHSADINPSAGSF